MRSILDYYHDLVRDQIMRGQPLNISVVHMSMVTKYGENWQDIMHKFITSNA